MIDEDDMSRRVALCDGAGTVEYAVAAVLEEIRSTYPYVAEDDRVDQLPSRQSGFVTPTMVAAMMESTFSRRCGGAPSPILVRAELGTGKNAGCFTIQFFERSSGRGLVSYEDISSVLQEGTT